MPRPAPIIRAVAILTGGVLAAWVAIGVTLDQTMALQAPAAVRAWWPAGVRARVVEGASLVSTATPATIDRTRASVRDAALREPVNTFAVSTLGALDAFRHDRGRAAMLFGLSETLSRRNSVTEYWLIEDAVGRGDVRGALAHYDRAMRVSNEARVALVPILVRAASGPAVLRELIPLLARKPLWWQNFADAVVAGDDPRVIGSSLVALRPDLDVAGERALAERGLRRMLALGAERAAIVTANRLEGVAGTTRSLRNGGFQATDGLPPFAWALRDEGSMRAYRDVAPGGGGRLHVTTTADASGQVAEQLVGLAAGRYVLRGRAGNVPADMAGRPAIEATCGDGRPIARSVLPAAGDAGTTFGIALDVPGACPTQWLRLVTAPAVDSDFWIADLVVRP